MKIIDIFAGCGGFSHGFNSEGFQIAAHIDWDEKCVETLKLNYGDSDLTGYTSKIYKFDMENIKDDFYFGKDSLGRWIEQLGGIDGVIGGPPCQSYSIAGRIRDPYGMQNDYRNYLFESYVNFLTLTNPKYFVFENVPGILSSQPGGEPIVEKIFNSFGLIGYQIANINKKHIFNLHDYGAPQIRKRIVIFGVNKYIFGNRSKSLIEEFYKNLKNQVKPGKTVQDAISDLEIIKPIKCPGKRQSHEYSGSDVLHIPRYHNKRDRNIFKMLANDTLTGVNKYKSTESIKQLYLKQVGRVSNVHKYHVLDWQKPSNLIPAHLHKDGLRHIHPDPNQERSITPREAARLQTFPDNYKFYGSRSDIYKMIGNAVAPLFSKKIANAISNLNL